jgi:uncharacterized protein (DUF1800 family)
MFRARIIPAGWCLALSLAPVGLAQAPGEVSNLQFSNPTTLSWSALAGASDFNIYRAQHDQFLAGRPPACHANEVVGTSYLSAPAPAAGNAFLYLVTGEGPDGTEGTPGTSSAGALRALYGLCDLVERGQLLNRIGYGWNEYLAGRYSTLGVTGFLNEQLAPETIDESSNTDLNSRLSSLEPPENINELIGLALVRGVYARRQLQQVVTMFWANHFNTNYADIRGFFNRPEFDTATVNQLTVETQYRELEQFRNLAFNGTFREILEVSAKSPAMSIYLDNDENVVGRPQENYARELLELHSMGVDNGYTQHDIEELARALTGWNVCKKTEANKNDPLAPCINRLLEATTPGTYVINFRLNQHDHAQKVLFEGTPYEVTIPSTSGNQSQGVNDLEIALDAIADHPSTREYISSKLLQLIVQDAPTQPMIDAVVNAWQVNSGDLREVLRVVVERAELRQPDGFRNKLRTPLEQMLAVFRATRGKTNGTTTVRTYLSRMQHLPHQNAVPTGYAEVGDEWIDTNNTLERQNFGLDLTEKTASSFGTDLIALLNANGLSSSSTPEAIVDFWIEVLFGGAVTPADRQEAITYLRTDDNGVETLPLTDARIRGLVGFLVGYPNFQEQ